MLSEEDKTWIRELRDQDRQWVREQLEAVELRFGEKLEKVETTLLTEFHKWASPLEMRQRSHAMAIRALDDEMELISDRLKKLEKR
jgi:hypothetical protein